MGNRFSLGLLVVLLAGLGVAPGNALGAEPPSVLWGKEPLVCPTGSAAGQCKIPRGVAADPGNGHIFVADQTNKRVNEFNALGQFIKAWGWDVVQSGPGDDTVAPEDQFEICVPRNGDICKEGLGGAGAGQFSAAEGVALDSAGNVYVVDFSNRRVEKFNRSGEFLLAFGSPGTGPGQFGAWKVGSFIAIDKNGTASETDDKVYVGDAERIQRFNTEGIFQSEIPLPGKTAQGLAVDPTGNLYYINDGQPGVHKISPAGTELPPKTFELPQFGFNKPAPTAVAVDAAGDVYAFGPPVVESSEVNPIFEFDPEGNLLSEFGKGEFAGSTGLATNLCPGSQAPGNVYVTNATLSEGTGKNTAFLRAYGTEPVGCFKARTLPPSEVEEASATLNGSVNPGGLAVSECFFEFGTSTNYGQTFECDPNASELGTGSVPVSVESGVGSLLKGTFYHYRLIAKVGSEIETGSDEEFKTKGPPVISNDHTASTNESEATLKALVNPEGLQASCQFEYGPSTSYGQSTPVEAIGKDRADHLTVVILKELIPGAGYHWRIVCVNSSGTTEGGDHTFFTFLSPTEQSCPNAAFRHDVSAALPDCRAYEMVSPVDKNGGDIINELGGPNESGGYIQARPDGNAVTYTAPAAFAGVQNSFYLNQYMAVRTERGQPGEGWSSQGIHPPNSGQSVDPHFFFGLFREFMAFSEDLCNAWLVDYQTPPLKPDAQAGYANLYRRTNCEPGAGDLETLTTAPPPKGADPIYLPGLGLDSFQGASRDSSHVIFAAAAKILPEAAEGSEAQLYGRFDGALKLVSVLPDKSPGDPAPGDGMGFPASGTSEAGSGPHNSLEHAISSDGSRVYWTKATSTAGGPGQIYLRKHPEQGIVPEECKGEAACTIPVSAEAGALFWAASEDGSKAVYTEGEELFEFDLHKFEAKEPPRRLIAENVVTGVAGTSADLGRIYFVSTKALAGSGQNSEEDEAVGGQPNLYLAEGSKVTFVATLVAADVPPNGTGVVAYSVTNIPSKRATRVAPDGTHLAFESRARLTEYDNSDAEDGRPTVEVYVYDATANGGTGQLICASCNPSGAAPQSRELREPYVPITEALAHETNVAAAAWIPTWEHPLNASNVISASGDRLFFNSNDRLLPRDANGAQDVYEWEASGTGGCKVGDANYFASNGGCLYLVSSGESSFESEFWEASEDGRDVFFTTESSLLPQDPGSIDLYDARVDGGFPQPEAKAPCEGEACQSPPAPPRLPTPASGSYQGPGNVSQQTCPRGRHKVSKAGKSHCAKNHKRRHRAHHKRRAAR